MATAGWRGILGWVERTGNRLPDPAFLFLWLIGALVPISVLAARAGVAVPHPTEVDALGEPVRVAAVSLLSPENVRRLWTEMPQTFTHFHPLGYVLVVMLGAGVAERSGLFGAAMRAAVRGAPRTLLTPIVAAVGMMANLAADAAYVVLVPLAGVLYAAAGRHPIAGIAIAFAAVAGGFSANLLPGQLDALLFGITEAAAEQIAPGWDANIAGNWFFIATMFAVFLPILWVVHDRVVEPRLGAFAAHGEAVDALGDVGAPLSRAERNALRWALVAALAVVALWAFMTIGPGTPLLDEEAPPEGRLAPLYRSLVAGFLVLFLASGWAYGAAAGVIAGHRDVVRMMTGAMADMAYYLVLAFAAAHFVAMFDWSNLGLILAVKGAVAIESSGLPMPAVLVLLVLLAATANVFIGSASAKWALLAPVLVPMLMLVGVSPEMTTAAYRVGDSATNPITPLMVYFPLTLAFARRWDPSFGLGSLMATMLPYSVWILLAGLALVFGWVWLDLPLGPGAAVAYRPAP